ncbi:MAG: ABC transporter ATP-binding protein [Desulfomonilaceae bacterium]|nr:ABC transporter ATP-binding protein [Desulfomonilaceae bacterium]
MSDDTIGLQEARGDSANVGWREAAEFARYCIGQYPRSFFGVGILSLLSTALILPVPFISKSIVNLLVEGGDHFSHIAFLACLALVVIVFERFVHYWQGVVIFLRCRRLVYDLRRGILEHLLALPMLSLQETDPGTLGARVYNDTEKALAAFFEELISVCRAALTILVCVAAMSIIQWQITIVALGVIPLYVFLLKRFGRRIRSATGGYYNAMAADRGLYQHLLAGPEIAKMHSLAYVIDKYARLAAESVASGDKLMRAHALSNSAAGLVSNSLPIFILLFGAFLIIKGVFDLGSFIAFSAFSAYMFPSLRLMIEYIISSQGGLVALQRINELLRKSREDSSAPEYLPQGSMLLLENVSFSYPGHDRINFENITIRIQKGQFVGIVGESGSGKSTLLKVVCGLYGMTGGSIALDGRAVSSGAMRQLTSYVEQEPLIFGDTLVENVRLGRTEVSTHQVFQILEAVGLGGLLRQPGPHSTGENYTLSGPYIEQGGSNLSLGQKKRIALARALMKNASIIAIDEPTAGLDYENASKVMGLIRRVCTGKFVLIVSHSDQVTEYCDVVYEIKDSRLITPDSDRAVTM